MKYKCPICHKEREKIIHALIVWCPVCIEPMIPQYKFTQNIKEDNIKDGNTKRRITGI